MIKCNSCNTDNEPDALFCWECGQAFERPLCLRADTGRRFSLTISLRANQSWARVLGEDSQLWDKSWQMEFVKRDNRWFVVPNLHAANDTILNGLLLEREAPLSVGDVVAVGRARKNIIKTPLTVSLPALS